MTKIYKVIKIDNKLFLGIVILQTSKKINNNLENEDMTKINRFYEHLSQIINVI